LVGGHYYKQVTPSGVCSETGAAIFWLCAFASLRLIPFPFVLRLAGAGFLFGEFFFEGVEGQGVEDVGFGEAGFAGDAGAEAKVGGLFEAVGVAVDEAFDGFYFGVVQWRKAMSR